MMTQKAFEIVRKTDALLENHGHGNQFDEHIEEMMKIIVSQGRQICKELKRVQHHGDTLERKDKKLKSRDQANVVSQKELPEVKTTPDCPANICEESLDKENCLPVVNSIGQTDNEGCGGNSKSESVDSSCKMSEDSGTLKRSCRILPKIPFNAVKLDLLSQSFVDIPTIAKVSDEYSHNASDCLGQNTARSPLKRASSSWDVLPQQASPCSTILKSSQKAANFSSKLDLKQKKFEFSENPDSSEENQSNPSSKSRSFLKRSSSFLSKNLFKYSSQVDSENQKLADVEPKQSFSTSEMILPNPSGFSDSMTATCHSDFHLQTNFENMDFIRHDHSTRNPNATVDFLVLKKDTSLSDYYSMENSKLGSISNPDSITSSDKLDETISQMRLFSEELSRYLIILYII